MISKKIQQGLLLISTVCLTPLTLAQDGNIAEQLKQLFEQDAAKNEGVQRELFQDMKNFIGITQLKTLETQNVMRLMLPPYIDQTMAVGLRILTAEDSITPWQDTLLRDTANYNINTTEEESSDTTFITGRLEKAGTANLLNPYQDLDDLLASTLLNGHAFTDDQEAENAYQYIRHLTNFTPIKAMPEDEMFSDPPYNTTLTTKGAEHLMQVYKQLPSMTLAQNSLLAIHADKQRFKGFAKDLPIGDPATQSASLMEILAYEVERRYMNPDWYNEMNQMSEAGLLKEIANMMAFQMYVDVKSYQQSQRMEAMMAGQTGVMSGFTSALTPTPPSETPSL